jgi:hypothetical protein
MTCDRFTTIVAVTLAAVTLVPARADDFDIASYARMKPLTRGRSGTSFEFFLLKVAKPRVYLAAEGEAARDQPGDLRVGDLFFACGRSNGRVLLGSYRDSGGTKGWTRIVGWVAESDLLVSRLEPMSVSEGLKHDLDVTRSDAVGGLSPQNALFLRCVSKPDLRVRPGTSPGDKSGDPIARFMWFYVYDVRRLDDPASKTSESWLLVGRSPRLLPLSDPAESDPALQDTSEKADHQASPVLIGWVPLKSVTLWCSNLVLEYNTAAEAVQFRRERPNERACTVYSQRATDSVPLSTEPLDILWGRYDPAKPGGVIPYESIKLDPFGLHPEYPRHVVVQTWPDGWVEVASIGSTEDRTITEPEIQRLKIRLGMVNNQLRQADIVFVVDATGSMSRWVTQVQKFLETIANSLNPLQHDRQRKKLPLGNGGAFDLDTNLDISVSLVSFKDIPNVAAKGNTYTTKVHFARWSLAKQKSDIIREFNSIDFSNGDSEALHDGLKAALDPSLWREDSVHRLLVLLTDEPGDTNDADGVLDAMPAFTEEQRKLVPTLADLDQAAQKKKRTNIVSIYAGDQGIDQFTNKVQLFSDDVIAIKGVQDGSLRDSVVELLLRLLREKQSEIEGPILFLQRQVTQEEGEAPSLPGLSRLALEEALKRTGVTLEELKKLTKVAYYQGYVPFLGEGADQDQAPGVKAPPGFRARVMLNDTELNILYNTASKISTALVDATDLLKKDQDNRRQEAFGEVPSGQDAKSIHVCKIFLLAADQISGSTAFANDPQGKKLEATAIKMYERLRELQRLKEDSIARRRQGKSGKPDAPPVKVPDSSLALFFKVTENVPIRANGVLSKRAEDLLDYSDEDIKRLGEELDLRARGLHNIINAKVVSEKAIDVTNPQRCPAVGKEWFFTQPGSNTQYAYVPIDYIP